MMIKEQYPKTLTNNHFQNEAREAELMEYRKKQTLIRKLEEHGKSGYQKPKTLVTDKPEKLRSAVYY
jgi:hypothetical protein